MLRMRICPNCKNHTIDPAELFQGARCLSCHKTIEVNAIYAWGISIVLLTLALISFRYEQEVIGLIFTVTLLTYTAFYKKIASQYLPLKAYSDAN